MPSPFEEDLERAKRAGWTRHVPSSSPTRNTRAVPAGFTQEYRVLAEVADNMSSGLLLLGQGEHVAYANASALRLLRLNKQEAAAGERFDVHTHLLSLVADPVAARPELERVREQPEREHSVDLALLDAAVRWLRLRSFPVRDEHGRLLGRGMLFEDITLERSAAEARGETLALAAHELKTPLAIIKGCATTLLGSSARWDPAMQREMLQMIDTQSDRLHDVLNTLLDVWRLDAGAQLRLTQVRVQEFLQQLIDRWRRMAPTHSFELEVPTTVPVLTCDVVRVEQALNHLLDNAVKYSSPASTVTIRVEANEVDLLISVSDQGIGIAPDHLDYIFDRFYRVQEQEGNSGLGLAAARATIEAHGGRIWADSPGEGLGSVFYLTLPFTPHVTATTRPAISMPENSASLQQAPGRDALAARPPLRQDRRIRVLLAESDPRMARYLRANLEEQRYRVQTVNHGIQFLRQIDLEEPDVILLSTHLADMSGIELLQRLREFSQTPVIMLADNCDEDERVQLFDLGSDDLVIKPFGMKELLARVRAILRRQVPVSEQGSAQPIFTTGDLTIDYAQHLVTVGGQPVQLSRTEYKMLSVLAQNAGMVVTHELLLEKVWGPEYNRDIDFIWVYISRLRRKIEADSRRPKYILTVPDVGYKLVKM